MSYATSEGRPLPVPTEISAPHWEGAKAGRLMVQHCAACKVHVFIPRRACPTCLGEPLDWVESSGRGTVYSYTIIHRPPHPAFDPPYCAAIIELEEGWHMLSNIVGSPPEAIRVGLPVRVEFLEASEEISLPVFRILEE
jgi:uncharacterized OB-fold protein